MYITFQSCKALFETSCTSTFIRIHCVVLNLINTTTTLFLLKMAVLQKCFIAYNRRERFTSCSEQLLLLWDSNRIPLQFESEAPVFERNFFVGAVSYPQQFTAGIIETKWRTVTCKRTKLCMIKFVELIRCDLSRNCIQDITLTYLKRNPIAFSRTHLWKQ
jgi:hypothetical protein